MRSSIDPYAAYRRLLWRNRIRYWRQPSREAWLYGAAVAAGMALLAYLVAAQAGNVGQALRWLFGEYPGFAMLMLFLLAAADHQRRRRRQRRDWAGDWLSAQPIPSRVRRRRRWIDAGVRGVLQLAFVILPLAAAGLSSWIPLAALSFAGGALLGQVWADIDWPARLRPASRETPFLSSGHGRLWRWQGIEASASLAPRPLSRLLLVIILIPQGVRLMIVVAVATVALLAAVYAWQRSLWVIPWAQRWLQEQPLLPRQWLGRCLPLPLILLGVVCAFVGLFAGFQRDGTLLFVAVVLLPALGLLRLAVTLAERRQSLWRVDLQFVLHALVFLAVLQAWPAAAPVAWLMQMGFLVHRSLR